MSISRTDLPADDRAPIGLAALVPQPPAWAHDIAAGRSGPAISIADLDRSRLVSTRITGCADLDAPRLERAVDDAYAVLADALAASGHQPVRFWNFVPGIHADMGDGRDRYMVFNAGRYHDRVVRDNGTLKFQERLCVYDSVLVPGSLVMPI